MPINLMIQAMYALISFFSWGAEGIFDKSALKKLKAFNALSIRYFFVFFLVIFAALIFTEIKFLPNTMIPYFLFTCVIGSAAIIFFFKAMEQTTVSLATAIAKNYFLVTIAISVILFNESLSFLQWIAVLMIISALILLSLERKEKKFLIEKGTIFALLTVFGWGTYFALIKPIVLELNPFNASMFLESAIFFMILIYSLLTKKEIKLKEKQANLLLFGSAVLLVIGSIAYNFSIALIGASLTAIVVAPTPVLTSVLARIFLKEKLSKTKYLAIIVSVLGLVLLLI